MIYVIQSGRFVKIGYCDRDPIRRLEKLQIGNPIKLKLIALMVGDVATEREIHARYSKDWVRGEWFNFTRQMVTDFEAHMVDHDQVSRARPERRMEGVDARRVYAYLEMVNSGMINEDGSPIQPTLD